MYVYEELIDGQKLSEIINTKHENVKYLPNHKIPENVVWFDQNSKIVSLNYLMFRLLIRIWSTQWKTQTFLFLFCLILSLVGFVQPLKVT